MKKYMICGLFILMLIISFSASAQWNRHHGRYNSRYYSYPRYGYAPRTSISVIARLPFGAVSLNFGNRYYHYYNGIYYRPYNSGYAIVEPPIGIIVPTLPYGAAHIIIGSHPYYHYGNIYYAPYGNRYKVVEEPGDIEISSVGDEQSNATAGEYEKVILEGKTYYKKGNKYYKATVNKDGEIVYEEVGETSKSK